MTKNDKGLFPLDVSDYEKELVRRGKLVAAAVAVLETERAELRKLVVESSTAGVSQVNIAKLSGLARVTVRDWLGK